MSTVQPYKVTNLPNPSILYLGRIDSYDYTKGFGFIIIEKLVIGESFSFADYEPINKKTFFHYRDVFSDKNNVYLNEENKIAKLEFDFKQWVMFHLTVHRDRNYKAINVKSIAGLVFSESKNSSKVGEYHYEKRINSEEGKIST